MTTTGQGVTHSEHFEDLPHQADAARLGMWVFLASEVLLFAGLFALYCGYRAHAPAAFAEGVQHNPRLLGSLNTVILICSSYVVAMSVHMNRQGRPKIAVGLLAIAFLIGAGFLVVKFTEYGMHFHEGIFPGGRGHYFEEHADTGLATFYTLYFLATGLHAIHVTVGMTILAWLAVQVFRGRMNAVHEHPLSLGAMYWHLVDLVWIFLWPMFYLMHGR